MNQLKDLPNRDGFKFLGILHSGESELCTVRKINGMHQVISRGTGESILSKLKGWKWEGAV